MTALKLNEGFVEAHTNLGNAYKKKGLMDKAKEEFEIALKLRPNFIPAQKALASIDSKSQTYESK